MTAYTIVAARRVSAPPSVTYGIIADYNDGHAKIIPREVFTRLCVESGGVGDGTVIGFDVRAFGKTQSLRARIAEPVPGRVLRETAVAGEVVTTYTVDPTSDDRACDVTIETVMFSRDGVLGVIERALATRFLKKVYARELDRLDALARSKSVASPAAA